MNGTQRSMGYYSSLVTLLLALALVVYTGFLLFLDGNRIVEYEGPMKVAGVNEKSIDIIVKHCRYKIMTMTVYPAYTNGVMYNLQPFNSGGSQLGCFSNHKIYELPPELPNGNYTFQVRNEFKVNPLKTVIISWVSEPFKVNRNHTG